MDLRENFLGPNSTFIVSTARGHNRGMDPLAEMHASRVDLEWVARARIGDGRSIIYKNKPKYSVSLN
jgi:hypothetical protein